MHCCSKRGYRITSIIANNLVELRLVPHATVPVYQLCPVNTTQHTVCSCPLSVGVWVIDTASLFLSDDRVPAQPALATATARQMALAAGTIHVSGVTGRCSACRDIYLMYNVYTLHTLCLVFKVTGVLIVAHSLRAMIKLDWLL